MPFEHPYVRIASVAPEKLDAKEGWAVSDFRVVISGREGCSSLMYHATLLPGDVHHRHRYENCDMQYYVVSGHGLAGVGGDRGEVFAGDFHYIPAATEHWPANVSETEDLSAPGWYIGVGGLGESGFEYLGPVTEDDLKERTGAIE